jgi:hypothetical protein
MELQQLMTITGISAASFVAVGYLATTSVFNSLFSKLSLASPVLAQDSTVKVIKEKFNTKSKDGRCEFSSEYPQVENLTDKLVQSKVNNYLKSLFLKSYAPEYLSKEYVLFNSKFDPERCVDILSQLEPKIQGIGYSETVTHKIPYNRKNILSISYGILMIISNGTIGTSRQPNGGSRGLTINLKTGKVYSFRDLFKSNSNYIERLNQMTPILRKIDRSEYDFYLDEKKGLVLINLFTTYATRATVVEISPNQIADIINPNGPLASFNLD